MISFRSNIMLETEISGIKLRNPLVLAAGILGVTKESLRRVARDAGAVTTKSIGKKPRKGNPNPSIVAFEHGLINSVGLSNPGIDAVLSEFGRLDDLEVPVIMSIFARKKEELAEVAAKAEKLNPAMIEIDMSCPVFEYEGMPWDNPKTTEEIVRSVKKAIKRPLAVKLSPNTARIGEVALGAERGGADVITAVNTLPGMIINPEAGLPVLSNRTGGVSGPALKPIAIRAVYEIYEKVSIPIIGVGGVTTGRDAVEMLMAGASAVGVGSAVYYRGVEAFAKIKEEMEEWMRSNNVRNVKEIRGLAHRR